jgi:hypothetical protein
MAACVYGLADKFIVEVKRRNLHVVRNGIYRQGGFVSSSLVDNPSKRFAEML